MIVVDRDGRIMHASASCAAMMGKAAEDLIGVEFTALTKPRDGELVLSSLRRRDRRRAVGVARASLDQPPLSPRRPRRDVLRPGGSRRRWCRARPARRDRVVPRRATPPGSGRSDRTGARGRAHRGHTLVADPATRVPQPRVRIAGPDRLGPPALGTDPRSARTPADRPADLARCVGRSPGIGAAGRVRLGDRRRARDPFPGDRRAGRRHLGRSRPRRVPRRDRGTDSLRGDVAPGTAGSPHRTAESRRRWSPRSNAAWAAGRARPPPRP